MNVSRLSVLGAMILIVVVALAGSASAVLVDFRIQAESMQRTGSVTANDDTGDSGSHIRFTGTAGTSSRVTATRTPSDCVDQIQLRSRESGSGAGDDKLGVWINGTAAGNKVGEVQPPAGNAWGTQNVNLVSPLTSGQAVTIHVGPAQTNDAFVALDYIELHKVSCSTGGGGDTTDPTTTLSTNLTSTNDNTPSFTFSGSDAGGIAGFECQMDATDASGWESCTSPFEVDVLSDGSHTFNVRAKDTAGRVDATPASDTFTVDATAPEAPTFTSGPENGGSDTDGTFSYGFSGEVGATFECALTLGTGTPSYSSCTSPKSYTSQADGTYTFRVRQTDTLGNVSPVALRTILVSSGGQTQPFSTKVQAETFTESRTNIRVVDGTTDEGQHLQYAPGSTTADVAQKTESFSGAVTSIDLRANSNSGTDDIAIYVDGTAAGDKVATFTNLPTTMGTRSANVDIPSGAHTIYVGVDPSTTTAKLVRFDWITFNGVGTGGGAEDTVDPTTTLIPIDSPTNDPRPSFTFSGTDNVAVAGFFCRVDSGTWNPCVSPYTTLSLSSGTHTFEVRSEDTSGRVDQTPASQEFEIDTTAPDAPSITGGPSATTPDPDGDVSYTFSGEANASFECSLDTGTASYSECTSPHSYNGLSNGSYTFRVRQMDEAGNTSADSTRALSVAIPTTGEDLPQTIQAEEFTYNSSYVSISDGNNDIGSSLMFGGLAPVSAVANKEVNYNQPTAQIVVRARGSAGTEDLAVYVDGTTATNKVGSSQNLPTGFADYTYNVSVSAGPHTIYIGPDSSLSSTARLRVDQVTFKPGGSQDTTPPTTNLQTIQSPTNDDTPTFSFTGSDSGGVAGFECRVDSALSFSACTSPFTLPSLDDGSHTFSVRAKDNAGLVDGSPAQQTFTVDTQTPNAPSISSPSSNGTTDTDGNLSFTFSGEVNAKFECSLSTGADNFSACTSPRTYTSQSNGSYTFKVKQVDQAGNESPVASRTLTVNVSGGGGGSAFNPGVGKVPLADCDKTLAAGGNLGTFINSLGSGQVGCLRNGTYTSPNSVSVQGGGWKLGAVSGEQALYRGAFDMNSVSGVEFEGFSIDASYSPVTNENNRLNTEQAINLRDSSNVVVDSMDIQNRRSADLSGTCIFGGTSRSARITYSYIHKCGELPNTNREHGIYVANSDRLLVEHSWFADIADRAVSYHSAVTNARSYGIVIDSRNNAPAWLYGGAQNTSIANSVSYTTDKSINIGSAGGGSGNAVSNVCANQPWDVGSGVSYTGMLQTTPTFNGFKVTGPSTCLGKLPADSPFRP